MNEMISLEVLLLVSTVIVFIILISVSVSIQKFIKKHKLMVKIDFDAFFSLSKDFWKIFKSVLIIYMSFGSYQKVENFLELIYNIDSKSTGFKYQMNRLKSLFSLHVKLFTLLFILFLIQFFIWFFFP